MPRPTAGPSVAIPVAAMPRATGSDDRRHDSSLWFDPRRPRPLLVGRPARRRAAARQALGVGTDPAAARRDARRHLPATPEVRDRRQPHETAQRLLSVAQVLDVAVDYVFEHLDERWPALEARAFLKLGRLLNAVARDHPEIVQAVLLAIAAEAAAAAGAAPAVRAGSPGAAAGTERGGMASPGRPWAGMERIPAAGRV
jgi:hypothetical protein